MALTRSGHSAATMFAVRAPQSQPAMIALSQVRNDHPVAGRRQQRRHVDIGVDVVRPAVQKNDRRAVGRTCLGIADVQDAGIDPLQRAE
jgi:hypothetical protein